MVKVEVIKPAIGERKARVLNAVYYPYMAFQLRCKIKRPIVKPIYLEGVVTVDMSRAIGMLSDAFPEEVEVREVDESLVIPPRIGRAEAEGIARRTFLYLVLRTRRIAVSPEIEVLRSKFVHKEYWIVQRDDGKIVLVDTLTGDTELVE